MFAISCTSLVSLQVENEAALVEVRGLQERLEASEHVAESLRRELRELGTRQGHAHTELHQARLQVAQLTLQLSEENLVLREERANWALEREAYKHAAEVRMRQSLLLHMHNQYVNLTYLLMFFLMFFLSFLCRLIKRNYKT